MAKPPPQSSIVHTGVRSSTLPSAIPRTCLGRVLNNDQEPVSFSVGSRPIVFGAGDQCDIIVEDSQVSRKHVQVSLQENGLRVEDLGSTNGTFIQGARIREAIVSPTTVINIGETQIRFEPQDSPQIPPSKRERFGALIGQSFSMRELFAILEMASPTDTTVLIEGESGTGKELTARAIHDHSNRAEGPMVVVDCSAITENLFESHLFGHIRGSFTGALQDRKGAFIEASGGTLFLDELGELPLSLQAKLLRVLEDRSVQPVGSDHRVQVDTRVIAATHRDLREMVDQSLFRFDLFYRMAVVHIHLPPLRDRLEDLPKLVSAFYEAKGLRAGPIDGENLAKLHNHSWPGNVRELRNILDRAWAFSPPEAPFQNLNLSITPMRSTPSGDNRLINTTMPFKEAKEAWLEVFEKRYIAAIYAQNNGNITHSAEQSGINRRHFRTLLKKHGIYNPE